MMAMQPPRTRRRADHRLLNEMSERTNPGQVFEEGTSLMSPYSFLRGTWRSASFADQYQTVQAFIEAYGVHQAFRSSGLHPR
jgi:hypothetical protein